MNLDEYILSHIDEEDPYLYQLYLFLNIYHFPIWNAIIKYYATYLCLSYYLIYLYIANY